VQRKNNTEFITELMDFADSGPLMQPFIIEAIYQHAKLTVENPLSENDFISPKAWTACAQEVIDKLEQRLEMK